MRTAAVVEPGLFSAAERSAMRLDGDCFDLGLSSVAVDALVGPEVRAASLAPAVGRHPLVVVTRAAAWVHGVVPALPHPLTLAVDVRRGRATRAMRPTPREARFGPGEVERLGGVPVTTPLKTAFDLLLREGGPADPAVLDLLRLTGLGPEEVEARIAAMPKRNGKHRVAGLARDLLLRGARPRAGSGTADGARALLVVPDAARAGQPAETRYTS